MSNSNASLNINTAIDVASSIYAKICVLIKTLFSIIQKAIEAALWLRERLNPEPPNSRFYQGGLPAFRTRYDYPTRGEKRHVNQNSLKCANPSCDQMKWQDRSGKYFDYCRKSCRDRHRKRSQQVIKKAYPENFQMVQEYFVKRWHRNKGTCGELQKVFVIDNHELQNQFDNYLSTLDDKTHFMCYHGTSLKCSIYDSMTVCSREDCGVCGIIRNGFLEKFISANIKYQRFGDAFYFALNSSKSHDYTQGHGKYRAMLLCKVAVGKRYITQSNYCKLKTAPLGYDSVHGKHGGTLNYDEITVYHPEAVLPTYALFYVKDGIGKIAR